eukprot:7091269-Pyramimonas_sp.AAC.1
MRGGHGDGGHAVRAGSRARELKEYAAASWRMTAGGNLEGIIDEAALTADLRGLRGAREERNFTVAKKRGGEVEDERPRPRAYPSRGPGV